ncbi:MAG TPA: hypothetical protein VI260_01305 [Blastocatellia bacterium]|jgi:hypothetical protein
MIQSNQDVCPVCNNRDATFFAQARDLEYFTTSETFTYLRCSECSTVFLRTPPVDRLHEIYPKNYYSAGSDFNQSFLYRIKDMLEKRMFRKILRSVPGDSISALDVGGGHDWMLNTVREAEPRVRETFVLDFDESSRRKAEEAGHEYALRAVVPKLAITCYYDYYHCSTPDLLPCCYFVLPATLTQAEYQASYAYKSKTAPSPHSIAKLASVEVRQGKSETLGYTQSSASRSTLSVSISSSLPLSKRIKRPAQRGGNNRAESAKF